MNTHHTGEIRPKSQTGITESELIQATRECFKWAIDFYPLISIYQYGGDWHVENCHGLANGVNEAEQCFMENLLHERGGLIEAGKP